MLVKRSCGDQRQARVSTDPGLYQVLFELSSDPMLVVEGDCVVDANRRAQAVLGETRDALVGRELSRLLASIQPDGRSSGEVAAELATAGTDSSLGTRWLFEAAPFPAPVQIQHLTLGDRQLIALSWHPEGPRSLEGGSTPESGVESRAGGAPWAEGTWRDGERNGRVAGAPGTEDPNALVLDAQASGLPAHFWGVPVQAAGLNIGVLGVSGDPRRPLAEDDRQLLESISRQASEALQRARLLEEARERARRERLIRDISDRMQRATDLETLLKVASQGLVEAFGALRVYARMGIFEEPGEE